MPTNNFKLFDQNKANLLSDTEYANATQRLNGVQTGVASSQLNNKFAYQVSLVAYAIAQIMNQNGLDASDTLSVSAFVGNLGGSLLQKVADRASSAEAAAGVLANKYISPATMKAAALLLSGGVMTGTLDMNNNQIINLPTPTSNSEPATKGYVDGTSGFEAFKRDLFLEHTFDMSNYSNDYTFTVENVVNRIKSYKGILFYFKFNNYKLGEPASLDFKLWDSNNTNYLLTYSVLSGFRGFGPIGTQEIYYLSLPNETGLYISGDDIGIYLLSKGRSYTAHFTHGLTSRFNNENTTTGSIEVKAWFI